MKKILLIICLFLCSCKEEQGESNMNQLNETESKGASVTFINDVEEADIWIIPQTEENLNSSVWGTPTFSKMRAGEKETHILSDEGTGKYIVRIIDTDQAYYASNDIVLDNHYTVRFETDGAKYDAQIVVLDEKGNIVSSFENVFEGVFGAN